MRAELRDISRHDMFQVIGNNNHMVDEVIRGPDGENTPTLPGPRSNHAAKSINIDTPPEPAPTQDVYHLHVR